MPTKDIDYGKLSLMDALDLALLIEEEARDRYSELAEQLEVHHTPAAGAFFRKMIAVEEKHRAALDERRGVLFGDAPRRVTRAMIFDVEAPDYDAARANMSVREALEAALSSEVKAHDFFTRALPQVQNPQVKDLFHELQEEEIAHQAWVRAELARLPKGDEPEGDMSDEPVAH